ncbi:TPA: hypothetical protein ACHFNF_004450, partial [Enterobacter hormaechei]
LALRLQVFIAEQLSITLICRTISSFCQLEVIPPRKTALRSPSKQVDVIAAIMSIAFIFEQLPAI